ncbi:MAG: hypothetical protein LBE16_06595, partial [Clostridiales Family XIII bacterium]|nr:hypothetical protein [Clostridiales Family XIII bacterium]
MKADAVGDETDEINNLSVSVSHENYQTWTELTNNTPSPELTVTLAVTLSESYVSGGAIDLPLNFTPTLAAYPTFTYGTDGDGALEPFFKIKDPEPNEMVKKYDLTTTPGVLSVKLKDKDDPGFKAGLSTIPLRFAFNTDWESKIPGDTVLWRIAPTAYVRGAKAIDATPQIVKGAATNVLEGSITRLDPAPNTPYMSGPITIRLRANNNSYYETHLDPTYQNRLYLEVPTGFVLSDTYKNYFADAGNPVSANGRDRYYRTLDPNPDDANHVDWNAWHYNGLAATVFEQLDGTITPLSMANGANFVFYFGADYKQINGAVKSASFSATYKKTERPVWALFTGTKWHNPGDIYTRLSVSGLGDGSFSQTGIYAGISSYSHSGAVKNIGSGPITGVSFVLYQNEPGSPKVNFHGVTLYANRDYPDDGITPQEWSCYKVQYKIFDTNSKTSVLRDEAHGVWKPSSSDPNTRSGTLPLTLPALESGQYIDEIIVTPMGTGGESEGVWPSRNGLALSYSSEAWPGRLWPDGKSVPNYTQVKMGWRLHYDDGAAYSGKKAVCDEGSTGYARVYYTEAPFAQAAFASS